MKTIAILAAGAAALGGGAVAAHAASSSTDAVRAVQTASRGLSHKAYDLERDRNRWEVKFADGTERHVTLDGRKVTATRLDDDHSARVASARVSLASALKTAAARGNGTLTDAEIDTTRGGTLVWSVSFERSDDDETEVRVDAKSGRVVSVTHENDD
jgi:uncharacterized membrane protein YkoI